MFGIRQTWSRERDSLLRVIIAVDSGNCIPTTDQLLRAHPEIEVCRLRLIAQKGLDDERRDRTDGASLSFDRRRKEPGKI